MADVGFWQGIAQDLGGKGQLRLIIQPLVAIVLGIRLGIADAKEGKDPFLLRLFVTEQDRKGLLKRAFHDALIPFSVAVVLDCVLQAYTLGHVRPLAAVVVGALLVWLPFSLARALTNRIATRRRRGTAPPHAPHAPSPA
jgi:hypothetical protein